MNQWKAIPLEKYEAQMLLPEVGQAEFLSQEFANAIASEDPQSIALIGSAGGNGLDCLKASQVDQILCIDVNPQYIEALKNRHGDELAGLACFCSEIEAFECERAVDFAFGGLIFEYTRLPEALATLSRLVRDGGTLQVALQVESQNLPTVSPTAFSQTLDTLIGFFEYVPVERFAKEASKVGFEVIEERIETLDSKKSFACVKLQKSVSSAG